MLAIRMQRRGRKGLSQFRVIVQEARLSPKSGKVVASLGSYDPHAKTAEIDKEKSQFYLTNGAQPSQRVAKLFKDQGIKLPDWVEIDTSLKSELKHPEKLRKNRPAEEPAKEATPDAEATADSPAEEPSDDQEPATQEATETPVEEAEPSTDDKAEAEPTEEKPADEAKAEEPTEDKKA